MSRMLRVYPRLRLHSALNSGRGVTIEKAIGDATSEMGAHEGAAFKIVDEKIAELTALCAARGRPLNPQEIFEIAEEIVDLGGLFSPHLCRAAQSLCALAQKGIASGVIDRAAVVVHVESVQLLRMMGNVESPTTSAIVQGLAAVVAKARCP